MRWSRVLVLSLVAIAGGARAETPPSLQGVWKDADRGLLVELYTEKDGLWFGKVVRSDRKAEVGKVIFQALRFDETLNQYRGTMIKPDDDAVLSVTLTLTSADSMQAVAKVLFLNKTIAFTRQPASR